MSSKIALVTGSSRGIGKAIALQLAQAGYDLGIHYSTTADGAKDTLEKVRAMGVRAELFHADICNVDEIHSMFNEVDKLFDHIDLMVNNAGITRFQPFLEATPEMFDIVINTDMRGTFFCAQAAALNMVKNNIKGVIINISSNQSEGCWPSASFYGAAKAGLNKMSKNIAMELSQYGIRVVTVAPGYTAIRGDPTTEEGWELRRKITDRIPAGRFANPEEIGDAVVLYSIKILCS